MFRNAAVTAETPMKDLVCIRARLLAVPKEAQKESGLSR
jgi:hypothetical protein